MSETGAWGPETPAGKQRPVDLVEMPPRVRRLPRSKVGYPIPWFVAELENGERDFRVADGTKIVQAARERLCWVCGFLLGSYVTFTVGPMCAINRISGEPPAHRDCSEYAVKVCPFMVVPGMRRRGRDDLDWVPAAGNMIERNPGAVLVWVTRSYRAFRSPMGNDGALFSFGDPTDLSWWREGRPATRDEVVESMESGLPTLLAECDKDDDPPASRVSVRRRYEQAQVLLPA